MTVDVSAWSETPASNVTIDSKSIADSTTSPPGVTNPNVVNDALRAIMAGVKTFHLAYSTGGGSYAILTGVQTLTNKTLTSPVINTPTIATPTITGTAIETVFTIADAAAFEINPANGSIQIVTLGASRTPKGTSFANGQAITLGVDDGTAYTLTWSDTTFGATGVKWIGGSGPALATTGYTWVTLWKVGGQVYGSLAGSTA